MLRFQSYSNLVKTKNNKGNNRVDDMVVQEGWQDKWAVVVSMYRCISLDTKATSFHTRSAPAAKLKPTCRYRAKQLLAVLPAADEAWAGDVAIII